jgi:hypothetical protein
VFLVKDVEFNFIVKLSEKQPPLRVIISYPDGGMNQREVQVYTSFTNKIPSAASHLESYINPTLIVFAGIRSKQTGRSCFESENLYITVKSQDVDTRARLLLKFKEEPQYNKKYELG